MSGKSIRNYKNAFPDDIDPCLAEWSQIQLAPIRDDDSENRHQGSLPYFSPYATYFKPKYTSPGDAAKRGPASYSPGEEHRYAETFYNHETSHSCTSTPTKSANTEGSPPSAELQLEHSTGDALAQYQAKLVAINGVVIPARNAPNWGSLKPSGTLSSNIGPLANHTCPICGAVHSQKYELACHFIVCVDRYGNPDGACWDDCSGITEHSTTPQQQPYQLSKHTASPHQSPPQSTKPLPPPKPIRQGPLYTSARKSKFLHRLNAVNGVVVPPPANPPPSKSHPAALPSKSRSSTPLQFACPLCKCLFGRRDHVRSHFVACVERVGNPGGVRWDEGLPKVVKGPRGPMGVRGG